MIISARIIGLVAVLAAAIPMSFNPVQAASPSIPNDVTAFIDGMKQICADAGGNPSAPRKTFLRSGHLRGLPELDWVIDQDGFNCDGAASIFGGSGGSPIDVFIGLPNHRARQAFENYADGLRIERGVDQDTLWLHVGGHLCGQDDFTSNADPILCERPLVWNKTSEMFDFAPVSMIKPLGR